MLSEYLDFFSTHLLDLNFYVNKLQKLILDTKSHDGRIIFVGNGGSNLQHIAHDINKVGQIRTCILSSATHLTCLFNDYGEWCYAEWLKVEARKQDLVILISSSGESENMIKAASMANELGCYTVGISAFNHNNRLLSSVKLPIYIPTKSYGIHELTSEILLHSILDDIVKEKQ